MNSLHQRLLKSFEYLKDKGIVHTQTQFAEAIGKTQPQVNEAFKDKPKRCTLGLMKAIADAFPDLLNRDYLLTGEGDVAAPDRSLRPHFAARASAGFMDGSAEGETGTLAAPVPGFDYDFSIEAAGDSMEPTIESGDVLLCRRCTDRANPPRGKICVVDSKEGAAVKVVASATGSAVTLHSLNPRYPDYDVPLDALLGLARVVALVRTLK